VVNVSDMKDYLDRLQALKSVSDPDVITAEAGIVLYDAMHLFATGGSEEAVTALLNAFDEVV
jgi:hypothetical protein